MAVFSAIAAAVAGSLTAAVAGKALGGGGGGGGGGGPSESPTTTLNNIKQLTSKSQNVPKQASATVAAKSAAIPSVPGMLKDPWQPTKDWYKDLGGEGDLSLDSESM